MGYIRPDHFFVIYYKIASVIAREWLDRGEDSVVPPGDCVTVLERYRRMLSIFLDTRSLSFPPPCACVDNCQEVLLFGLQYVPLTCVIGRMILSHSYHSLGFDFTS